MPTAVKSGSISRFIKVLVGGPSGAGKTRFGIDGGIFETSKLTGKATGKGETWPALLIINAEGGSVAYEHVFSDVAPFATIDCKTVSELLTVVKEIEAIGGVKLSDGSLYSVGTLMVDTWTTIRNVYREAMAKQKAGQLGKREFSAINRQMEDLADKLTNLPCHLILIAHETDEYAPGVDGAKIGVKIDADKKIERIPDFILIFQEHKAKKETRAFVKKARGIDLGDDNMMLINPSWQKDFKKIAGWWSGGEVRPIQSDEDAARQDAKFIDRQEKSQETFLRSPSARNQWAARQLANGYTKEQLRAAIGDPTKFDGTAEDADKKFEGFLRNALNAETAYRLDNAVREEPQAKKDAAHAAESQN